MAFSNVNWTYSFTAAEALNTEGHIGTAIALADNKVANDGKEADGVLSNDSKPASGENGSIVILGIAKARAGGALTKGAKVTVATSGYFIAVPGSGYYHVGKALEAVTSGSLGEIFFHGANYYQVSSM